MTVGSFLCDKMDVELNWGKPLYHTQPPSPISSPISQEAFCQIICLYSYVWPHSEQIFEYIEFQARKGAFLAPEVKRPRVGSGHYELVMVQCISYQKY